MSDFKPIGEDLPDPGDSSGRYSHRMPPPFEREPDVPDVLDANIALEMPPRPHPGFWWAVLWCVGLILVTQIMPGILGVILFIILNAGDLQAGGMRNLEARMNSPEFADAMLPAFLVSEALSIGTAWLAIRLILGKDWPRILGLRMPSASHLVFALIGFPGLLLANIGIDALVKHVPSFMDLDSTTRMFGAWPWPLGVLIIGLGPGIGEELWFRGFFGRGLVGRYGVFAGVMLTSFLFGLIHLDPRQAVVVMVMGVVLHLCYLSTRSLLVPMLLHTLNNSLSVLAVNVPVLQPLNAPAEQIHPLVYVAGILLLAAVGWALVRTRSRLVDRPDAGGYPWRPAFPSVEYPPLTSATRAVAPAPNALTWIVVIAALLAFAVAVTVAAFR
ncbi:MAG: CPBP family intramembrane metalloprotease [Planctomycetes bacterium]|nr:CPBP family intramembrane metalloprotease [Planctomycetota bacterium]